jgi:hypothetical protein
MVSSPVLPLAFLALRALSILFHLITLKVRVNKAEILIILLETNSITGLYFSSGVVIRVYDSVFQIYRNLIPDSSACSHPAIKCLSLNVRPSGII